MHGRIYGPDQLPLTPEQEIVVRRMYRYVHGDGRGARDVSFVKLCVNEGFFIQNPRYDKAVDEIIEDERKQIETDIEARKHA